MWKIACLLLLTSYLASADDSLTEGTELVFTLLIHRHGDRTPIASSLAYSTDPEGLAQLSEPYGYGQLTKRGKIRGYELGKFIRSRYEFLSPQFNRSEVYIRSTDSTRTKMTVLAAMAAVYPPVGVSAWSDEIAWTPVPYTTMPAKYDDNLAFINCPTIIKGMPALYTDKPASMKRFSGVLDKLSKTVGFDLNQAPAMAYPIYDVFTSQMSLGLPLTPEIQAIFPEVEKAAGEAIGIIFGNEKYIALQAGVLLQEFYDHAAMIQAGEDTQPLRIYSAHDTSVFSFLSVTKAKPAQGVPKYGSAYALELRRVAKTGQYVVLPVYLRSPEEEAIYLQFEGCGALCDYQDFVTITSKYAMDKDTWRTKCGFTEDLVVDESSIA